MLTRDSSDVMAEEGDKQEFKGQGTTSQTAKDLYTEAGKAFEQNEFEKAITLYSRAIREDPGYASAYFNRALVRDSKQVR